MSVCCSEADSKRWPGIPDLATARAHGVQVGGTSLANSCLVTEWSTIGLGKPSRSPGGHFSENHHKLNKPLLFSSKSGAIEAWCSQVDAYVSGSEPDEACRIASTYLDGEAFTWWQS